MISRCPKVINQASKLPGLGIDNSYVLVAGAAGLIGFIPFLLMDMVEVGIAVAAVAFFTSALTIKQITTGKPEGYLFHLFYAKGFMQLKGYPKGGKKTDTIYGFYTPEKNKNHLKQGLCKPAEEINNINWKFDA